MPAGAPGAPDPPPNTTIYSRVALGTRIVAEALTRPGPSARRIFLYAVDSRFVRIFPPPLRTVAPGEKSKRSGGFRRYDFGGSGWCGG